MIEKISQSFIKDMKEYQDGGSCGHLMEYKWVHGKLINIQSDAMHLGTYTEYKTTGALPKNKQVPLPKMMKSGKDMLIDYRRAEINAQLILDLWKRMGFKMVTSGREYTKGRHKGTIDVVMEATKKIVFQDGFTLKNGDRFVIDIKISGLIDDRWSKHGWAFTPEQREYHGIQGKHYHYITGLPFMFMVVDPKAKVEEGPENFRAKFYRLDISEEALLQHLEDANSAYSALEMYVKVGFEPRPEFIKCSDCALKEGCADKHTYPHPEMVVID
jgi:hypothetical protein